MCAGADDVAGGVAVHADARVLLGRDEVVRVGQRGLHARRDRNPAPRDDILRERNRAALRGQKDPAAFIGYPGRGDRPA